MQVPWAWHLSTIFKYLKFLMMPRKCTLLWFWAASQAKALFGIKDWQGREEKSFRIFAHPFLSCRQLVRWVLCIAWQEADNSNAFRVLIGDANREEAALRNSRTIKRIWGTRGDIPLQIALAILKILTPWQAKQNSLWPSGLPLRQEEFIQHTELLGNLTTKIKEWGRFHVQNTPHLWCPLCKNDIWLQRLVHPNSGN